MTSSSPTRGQIERRLSQAVQTLLGERTGQRPTQATCQIFDTGFTIVLEGTNSPIERTLIDCGQFVSAEQLRQQVENCLKPQLKAVIEEIVQTPVRSILMDSDLNTGIACLHAVLQATPVVRDPEAIPKHKAEIIG